MSRGFQICQKNQNLADALSFTFYFPPAYDDNRRFFFFKSCLIVLFVNTCTKANVEIQNEPRSICSYSPQIDVDDNLKFLIAQTVG
jgi:hypothetical protein